MGEPPVSDAVVRPATPDDAEEIRSLVTRALLSAGFPPPDEKLDADLLTLSYYDSRGRGIWVAEREGVVVGCAALDVGDPGIAILRRLAGGALSDLLAHIGDAARARGYEAVETVLPPGLPGTAEALSRAGFVPASPNNRMLLRLDLRP